MVFQRCWVVPKATISVGRRYVLQRYVLRIPLAAHVLLVTTIW